MRILYSHRIQSRDGQSVHVEELVAALREAGHEVLVVGPGFYDSADFGGESGLVSLIRARLPKAVGELAEVAYNLPAYRRLAAASRRFAPDLIYERYNLYHLAGTLLSRRTGLPLFLEVNAPIAAERAKFGGLGLPRLARRLENFVWRSAERVLAVTGVLRDIIAAQGVLPGRIEIVPNGIVPARFAGLPTRPSSADPVVLGFVGFVRSWHGLDAVLDGMAAHRGKPRIVLALVGEGPARPELERKAAALGLAGDVYFTGLAERAAIPALVAGFDIALQPRVVDYASPLKIFEYMAAGRAIVAPDQPNIREILAHDQTALLFDPADPAALWAAIRRLIDDPSMRARLGAAAAADIARRDLTWQGNARRLAAWGAAACGHGDAAMRNAVLPDAIEGGEFPPHA